MWGRYSVWAGGVQQSGPLVEELWGKFLRKIPSRWHKPKVLILGLGCGSVVRPLQKKFGEVKIIGVEIDETMLALGEKYFNLQKETSLDIICADARDFLRNLKAKFNLVLVDAYIGRKQLKLRHLRRALLPGGLIIVNKLCGFSNEMVIIPKQDRS